MTRAAAALALLALAAARVAALDDVEVAAQAPWSDPGGYTPVIVSLIARRAVEVALLVESGRSSARLTVSLAAGESARRTILLPPTGGGGSAVVHWRAGDIAGEVPAPVGTDIDQIDVVALDPLEALPLADLARALESRVTVRSHRWSGSSTGYPATRMQRVPADRLPDRWQGWPAVLTLFTTPEGDAQLNDEQRRAIADWTRAGGALFVAEQRQVAEWRALGVVPAVLGLARGGAAIDAAAPGPAAVIARLTQIMGDRGFAAPRHRVPGTEHVAVGGFTLVAGLFALLVGPLNLWWVRRRDARHLFLVTTPLLSLATCVGLVGFDLIAEGLSLRRAARQYAILDQGAQRVACWTGATWFAGFAVSALALDVDAKALPFDPEDDNPYRAYRRSAMRDNAAYALDWRDGQRATGAWIPARVNRHLAIVDLRPERRRLIVTRIGAAWQATNGFDLALAGLRWRDPNGRWWGCEALAAGARETLAPASDPGLPRDVPWYGRAAGDRPPASDEVLRNDAGPAAHAAWLAATTRPCIARATLAGALVPPPGPAAVDAEPITTHLLAIVEPE